MDISNYTISLKEEDSSMIRVTYDNTAIEDFSPSRHYINEGDILVKSIVDFFQSKIKMTGDLDKVVFSGPATVIFEKGNKTVVKCMKNDKPNKKKGFVMCLCKHLIGTTEWNHLVRPHSNKPNIEFAVAEALCEHILGREKFKALIKEYVD